MAERRPNRVLGPEHEQFWSYCAEGELRFQRCGTCQHVSWPPVKACERCGSTALRWERVSGKGRIISWCTFFQQYYPGVLPTPWDTILVELDEGPLFVSNPHGFTNEEVFPNFPVTVSFIECEDDAGQFSLPVFERA